MIILIAFAFLAGIVTILSPCILPVLPIVLSSSVDTSGKWRPFGVVLSFVLSFTFFTLFLSTIVRFSGIPVESLRFLSIIILIIFGLSLLIPQFQILVERLFGKLTSLAPQNQNRTGLWGGIIIGLSLGLLWTPCVGPILASVISLALTGSVTTQAFVITLSYALGTAIPMFIVMQTGNMALQKVPWLTRNTSSIQKAFGVLMIITAIGIFFNIDRTFQTFILNTFPNYGVGLTKLEDTTAVKQELQKINKEPVDKNVIGKPTSDMLPKGPRAPELIPGGKWFNLSAEEAGSALTLADLKGKVVLVDFWTYSCINCIRTLPYLRQWHEKYTDKGLVIIGVHSPEFEFEKSADNVAQAIKDFKLEYPIVQDNDFATWRAYNNRYWPAKYFIDKDGLIRYTHFGEGAYDESEKVIQELLQEAGAASVSATINNPSYTIYAKTPETYLGYTRITGFASPEKITRDTVATYTKPAQLGTNQVAYQGNWIIMDEYANPQQGATLELNFESKEVYLVMRTKDKPAKVTVHVDDKLQYFGQDNKEGIVIIDADRLYQLITLPTPGRHILRLEFQDSNTELYAFTFG